jgi:phosphatidate cytidylyltransferase
VNIGAASAALAGLRREPGPDVPGSPDLLGTRPDEPKGAGSHDLGLRIISAAILAPLAIVAAYIGGWPFVAFWGAAALAIWWEWIRLVQPDAHRGAFIAGACALIIEASLAGTGRLVVAILIALLGALAAGAMATRNSLWTAGGVLYASSLLLALVFIRNSAEVGFIAIIFLFAVVWATDIFGYFVGRTMGGPKLAPSISPKKTWSGAIGGLLGAAAATLAIAMAIREVPLLTALTLGLTLSVVAQAGDLFESQLKRRFVAKDASGLIPGHGGVMDRLDGFLAAAVAMALFGMARVSAGAPMRGFVVW